MSGRRGIRALFGIGAVVAIVIVAAVVAVLGWSGVTLASDSTALAKVAVEPFGGKIEHVQAFGPDGLRIPIAIHGGRLTPQKRLTPGERVSVDVVVRRPGWLSWI